VSRAADLILGAMAAEVKGRTKWDEPPALFFLYLSDGECHARNLHVPDRYWSGRNPASVLSLMADRLGEFSDLLQQVAPEHLHGAAFYTETWTVEQPPAGTAERSEVMADALAHRVHTRPDKVEARSMWAVDRGGVLYSALQRRGIDGAPSVRAYYPKPGAPAVSGTVPKALERIVTAMLADAMPGR
jgi:hypothetical protein